MHLNITILSINFCPWLLLFNCCKFKGILEEGHRHISSKLTLIVDCLDSIQTDRATFEYTILVWKYFVRSFMSPTTIQ